MRRSFAVSWADTIVVPFNLRLRLRSLLVRMYVDESHNTSMRLIVKDSKLAKVFV